MEFIAIILASVILIIVFCYLLNSDYWQAYNNSKFIDEALNEQKIHARDASAKDKDPGNKLQEIL